MAYKKRYKQKRTKKKGPSKREILIRNRLSAIRDSLIAETDPDKIKRLYEEQAFLNSRIKEHRITEWRKSSPSVITFRG